MAFQTERYIVLKNGQIVRDYHTAQGMAGIHASIKNEGIEYDEIIQVDISNYDIKKNTYKDEYENDWKIKPLSQRIALGRVVIPEDHKLEGEQIVPMTLEDKVKAGKETLEPRMKAVGNTIELKSDAELIAEGITTQEQLDEERQIAEDERIIAEETMRILRAQAIANLGDKLKKVKE